MHYTGTIWRPPYEAASLLLKLTADCTPITDILVAPEITRTQEAIDVLSPLIDEVDQFRTTTLGMMTNMVPQTIMDLIICQ